MIKYLGIIILLIFTVSCSTKPQLLGEWQEVNYKRETMIFHEGGEMEIKQKGETNKSPINFKYEITESKENYVNFNVSVYKGKTFVKKARTKATFKDNNMMTLENLDFPDTKSNTYSRKN